MVTLIHVYLNIFVDSMLLTEHLTMRISAESVIVCNEEWVAQGMYKAKIRIRNPKKISTIYEKNQLQFDSWPRDPKTWNAINMTNENCPHKIEQRVKTSFILHSWQHWKIGSLVTQLSLYVCIEFDPVENVKCTLCLKLECNK